MHFISIAFFTFNIAMTGKNTMHIRIGIDSGGLSAKHAETKFIPTTQARTFLFWILLSHTCSKKKVAAAYIFSPGRAICI